MTILGSLMMPLVVNPFLMLPLLPIGIAAFYIRKYFYSSARDLKRLENIGEFN